MKIEIYTRDDCEYCAKAKEFLRTSGISYYEYNLTRGLATRDEVYARINKPLTEPVKLPVVIIDDVYIGGHNDMVELLLAKEVSNQQLKYQLQNGVAEVVFTKADGSERKMLCTLQDKYIAIKPTSEREKNNDVLSVWDIDKGAWRSFRYDRVISWKPIAEIEEVA